MLFVDALCWCDMKTYLFMITVLINLFFSPHCFCKDGSKAIVNKGAYSHF